MANGHGGKRPGAGRKKGPSIWDLTKDERVDLLKYCEGIGYDPVVGMIELARDPDSSPSLQLACHREVAKYIHPTLGQIKMEHSGKIEGDLSGKSVDELREMAEAMRARRNG